MEKIPTIAIIGGGSWATALVKILSVNVSRINWWVRSNETAAFIREYHHNPSYLTGVNIETDKVNVTADIAAAIAAAGIVILVVPAAFLKQAVSGLTPEIFKDKLVFSAIKGIVPETNQIVGEFIHDHFKVPFDRIGVVTGPCHAEEVALEKLSYLTVACQHTGHAAQLAYLLNCRFIRTTVSDDIFGTEYAAVLKNVIAIASGICHSLGYGDNFQAVLISNASKEIKRFIDRVHPISRDINDSAYLGDLLVTTYSQFSRNRTFGSMIGKGYSVKSAQLEMNMVAEGYYAVNCIYTINKEYGVEMPICNVVFRILYEHGNPVNEMLMLSEKLS
jgi:glycerol-3-phosphate dehydrogenase (NAD(P)+)